MDKSLEAARNIAAALQSRDADSLIWREHPEGGWQVGPHVMNNDAKFRVVEDSGTFTVGRLWFMRWNQERPFDPKPLGEADSREGVEALIRQSIAEDGIHALHHPEENEA